MIQSTVAGAATADIASALFKTTESLARELASPSAVPPDWSDFEWRIARAACAIQGISSVLAATLRWRGPDGWTRFLTTQRMHAVQRHHRLAQLLDRIDDSCRHHRAPAVALKGSALHGLGLYEAGERPMADIDLLVRPEHVSAADRALRTLGFRETWAFWKHRVFETQEAKAAGRLGEHTDDPIKIELHERISEILPWRITDISHQIFPEDASPGLNPYPSLAALMTHLLLHAAGAMVFRRTRMINLHDIALLGSRMTNSDWDQFTCEALAARPHWWTVPPLLMTCRYYPSAVPGDVLTLLMPHCPHRLRKPRSVSEVSLSHVWVEAFPGLNWSRSPWDALQYMGARILPSRDTRGMRDAMRLEPWAADDHWCRSSHTSRILKFAFSRIPRAATMHPVKAALQQES